MSKFMLGKKAGMTQLFDENGIAIPATVIDCGPVVVIQNKKPETDGYKAVKVAYGAVAARKVNKPDQGQFAKAGVEPRKVVREFKSEDDFELGQEILVSDMFQIGDRVDVSGVSKGKGFASTIKRHGQKGGMKTRLHVPSSSWIYGSTSTPGRVFKGKKNAWPHGR